eukprot:4674489-Amphidinium_carterae.1
MKSIRSLGGVGAYIEGVRFWEFRRSRILRKFDMLTIGLVVAAIFVLAVSIAGPSIEKMEHKAWTKQSFHSPTPEFQKQDRFAFVQKLNEGAVFRIGIVPAKF